MSNYDPYSPFGNQQPDKPDERKDDDQGNSVGEQYSFDNGPGYRPAPQEASWPGAAPGAPQSSPPPGHQPPNYPVSSQPVTGQPTSGHPMSPGWQQPTSPTPPPPMYQAPPPPAYQPPQSDTSFMSAGRVWATVGIVLGVIFIVALLLCLLPFLSAARYY